MMTFDIATDKHKTQLLSDFNDIEFQQKNSLKRWSNRTRVSTVFEDTLSSHPEEALFLISALEIIDNGISNKEYGQTFSHKPLRRREYAGGVYLGINDVQRRVISRLKKCDKIMIIYLDHNNNKDGFIIITDKDYPMFSLELADIYWEIFDVLQENAPSYSFEFEHFNVNEVPPHTEKTRKMYNRGL